MPEKIKSPLVYVVATNSRVSESVLSLIMAPASGFPSVPRSAPFQEGSGRR